ncbi:Putative sensory transduction regulator [Jatrophihabitans endophyticus]|uniref:Putative sensory transduction regulator n=1 Tax=Jatrophihabitans endophyticus TaxID=1206085 RepID=A0A1M5KHN7_9ACTN|nr:YbjN domain-containing protein [Jatrophihabitans endophyticus]SHG52140.1 Putative sensory transduction regulator [Jatrophihabitans endophyticus]
MFLRRFRSELSVDRGAKRAERSGSTEVLPTVPLLQQLLDEFGLTHSLDGDGDLLVRWEKCSLYFFFYGEQDEVLQARLYLNRRFSVDDRGSLSLLLDEWNRTRLFGKAYTILPDDGMVAICAEECHDFEGSTRSQLKFTVATWIDSLLRFADWVDDQV